MCIAYTHTGMGVDYEMLMQIISTVKDGLINDLKKKISNQPNALGCFDSEDPQTHDIINKCSLFIMHIYISHCLLLFVSDNIENIE